LLIKYFLNFGASRPTTVTSFNSGHSSSLNLAIHSWLGAMTNSQRAVTPWAGFVCGWQVNCVIPLLHTGHHFSAIQIYVTVRVSAKFVSSKHSESSNS